MTAKQRTGTVLLVLAAILIVVVPFVLLQVLTSPDTSPGSDTDRVAAGLVAFPLILLGFVFLVIGLMLVTAHMRREARMKSVLGRHVDGQWVCYEHAQRWCPECTAKAERQAREHEEAGAGRW